MPKEGTAHLAVSFELQTGLVEPREVCLLDRYLLTAIGFTPGGSVKVQYIRSSTHT